MGVQVHIDYLPDSAVTLEGSCAVIEPYSRRDRCSILENTPLL